MCPSLTRVQPVRLSEGLFVCGDHRSTATLNGAVNSAQLAAQAVAQHLNSKPNTNVALSSDQQSDAELTSDKSVTSPLTA
jgi:hypothetical protein